MGRPFGHFARFFDAHRRNLMSKLITVCILTVVLGTTGCQTRSDPEEFVYQANRRAELVATQYNPCGSTMKEVGTPSMDAFIEMTEDRKKENKITNVDRWGSAWKSGEDRVHVHTRGTESRVSTTEISRMSSGVKRIFTCTPK
jgi:hypothetical protein